MTKLTELTIHQALAKLHSREISAVDLTKAYLRRIEELNGTLNAYITVTTDHALAAAEAADKLRAADPTAAQAKPLLGIPLGIKDVLSTQGVQTTCGSNILKGYKPLYNATVVQRLLDAGMILLGKLNMDEFAMGSSNESSAYGIVRNPWDIERVPGGSSGGSGAAVAAHMAAAALGTDTGGSVRLPASFCGIVGLKPSYGRASRYGLVAYGSSLDQPGPMARTVQDAALLMNVIAGHDPLDSTSMNLPAPDYTKALTGDVKGLRIGIPKEYFGPGMSADVETAVRAAIAQLERMGATVREVSLPHAEYSLPTYYIIAPAEASANLARYDGIRFGPRADKANMWDTYRATRGDGFGAEVKRRIMVGTYTLSAGYYDAFYGKAQAVRTLIKQDFDQAFEQVDVLCAPVAPTTAFKIGQNIDDPLQMYLIDVLTISLNLAGVPGLSVPCGFDSAGLPIGLQIIGKAFSEDVVLRVGDAYQRATDWHTRAPKPITA
jgi:aspartyl-tRNA(Asn)/glutamyl-tRNA(Gln) amidotransferase subunit A